MDGLDPIEEDGGGVAFRDMIMLALLGFVTIVLLLLPHVRPPTKTADAAKAPGNVMVEIRWPDKMNTDVDLWVQAPGDRPVGYNHRGGRVFNLLRDDLGAQQDATRLNYEVSYTRGIAKGEYTVNVHLFSNSQGKYPIPVTVVVSVKKRPTDPAKQILTSKVTLRHINQELTVFRFRLDKVGRLVPGSVHALPRPLVAGASL